MSDYPENPGPLPGEKFCNPGPPLNPIKGDGALGNRKKGKMFYQGADKEDHVKTVQRMLMALEYSVGESGDDGDFADGTENGVIEFQKENKDWNGEPLKVDGLVGPETADALNRRMVGVWYDRYDTPPALTDNKPQSTVTSGAAINGIAIEAGASEELTLIVVDDKFKVISDDFLVLTKKMLNAAEDFEGSDIVQVRQTGDGVEFDFTFTKEPLKVFIRPNVIVFSRFPKGMEGDAMIRVVNKDDSPRCEWMPCRIVAGPLRRKYLIPMGEESKSYTTLIIANPGVGQSHGGGPFKQDDIIKSRWAFQNKTLGILETFFDREEDLFRDPEIEKHMKFITYFDDSLPADADHSLIYPYDASHIGPRSWSYPNLLPKLLKKLGIKADMVYAVSTIAKIQAAAFTMDGPGTTDFTFFGKKFSHGNENENPGCVADTIQPIYQSNADNIISMHEFFHGISIRGNCSIYDLYDETFDDYMRTHYPLNKREKKNKDDTIPEDFGEYNGVVYKTDSPTEDYDGRGGIGYGSDTPGKIEKTYGPELRDLNYPNIMDVYTDATDPAKCKIDKLAYQYTKDRIKAKLK